MRMQLILLYCGQLNTKILNLHIQLANRAMLQRVNYRINKDRYMIKLITVESGMTWLIGSE